MHVFIAGVMQGSRTDDRVGDQGYRSRIAHVLREHLAEVEIVDPWALHPESEGYDVERARATFTKMCALAGQVDVLVAYVPEASMGTAVEMWEAYQNGVRIYSISGLTENWVVKLLSSRVFSTLEDFEAFVTNGGLS